MSTISARLLRSALIALTMMLLSTRIPPTASTQDGPAPQRDRPPAGEVASETANHGRSYLLSASPTDDVVTQINGDYCPAIGGNTAYEEIHWIEAWPIAKNKLRVDVTIEIKNPTNCQLGVPCPEYETFPEWITAWIDWNGDGDWYDNGEVVMVMPRDVLSYGPPGISSWMDFVQLIDIPPGAVEPAAMRIALTWDAAPILDPCTYQWTWGDVYDQLLPWGMPLVLGVTVEGIGPRGDETLTVNDKPETANDIRYSANIWNPTPNYSIACLWADSLMGVAEVKAPTTDCAIDFSGTKPKKGMQNGRQVITNALYGNQGGDIVVSWVNTKTLASGTTGAFYNWTLFFRRMACDECGTRAPRDTEPPNWYTYWKKDNAAPVLNQSYLKYTSYDPLQDFLGEGPYGYLGPEGLHAFVRDPAAGLVEMPAITLFAPDCTATVLAKTDRGIHGVQNVGTHELAHWEAFTILREQNKPHGDSDELPDDMETENRTSPSNPDSCGLAVFGSPNYLGGSEDVLKIYRRTGDQEVWARRIGRNAPAGNEDIDFANPGARAGDEGMGIGVEIATRQLRWPEPPLAKPRLLMSLAGSARDSTTEAVMHGRQAGQISRLMAGAASLTGDYSTSAEDDDNDGQYDRLELSVGVDLQTPADLFLIADLSNREGRFIDSGAAVGSYDSGLQTVVADFDGLTLWADGSDGPYTVSRVQLLTSSIRPEMLDEGENVHQTAAWQHTQFERPSGRFTGVIGETPEDTNGNGLYDHLLLTAQVVADGAGDYALQGDLYSDDQLVASATTNATLVDGLQDVELEFDGRSLFYQGVPGPYTLSVLLTDDVGQTTDFLDSAHTTQPYEVSAFEHGSTKLHFLSDSGVTPPNVTVEGYKFLRVSVQIASLPPTTPPTRSSLSRSRGISLAPMATSLPEQRAESLL